MGAAWTRKGVKWLLPLALLSCAHWQAPRNGRIYTGEHDHLGVQPAVDRTGAGVTIQWSTDRIP